MLRVNLKTRELFVYGDIGPSWAGMVGAEDLVEALADLGSGDIDIRMNTRGGTADEGFAMVENLKRHDGKVTVTIDSLAASAGSLFLQPEFSVRAAKTARIMIHEAMAGIFGPIADLERAIKQLQVYNSSLGEAYPRLKMPEDDIRALLKAETWYTAKEAMAIGLVDEISAAVKPDPDLKSVLIPEGRYRNTPKDLLEHREPTPNRTAASLRIRQLAAKLRTNHG